MINQEPKKTIYFFDACSLKSLTAPVSQIDFSDFESLSYQQTFLRAVYAISQNSEMTLCVPEFIQYETSLRLRSLSLGEDGMGNYNISRPERARCRILDVFFQDFAYAEFQKEAGFVVSKEQYGRNISGSQNPIILKPSKEDVFSNWADILCSEFNDQNTFRAYVRQFKHEFMGRGYGESSLMSYLAGNNLGQICSQIVFVSDDKCARNLLFASNDYSGVPISVANSTKFLEFYCGQNALDGEHGIDFDYAFEQLMRWRGRQIIPKPIESVPAHGLSISEIFSGSCVTR